jgi:hypothetical protein
MGLSFRKVAYARYDVTWFVEQKDFTCYSGLAIFLAIIFTNIESVTRLFPLSPVDGDLGSVLRMDGHRVQRVAASLRATSLRNGGKTLSILNLALHIGGRSSSRFDPFAPEERADGTSWGGGLNRRDSTDVVAKREILP